MSGTERIKRLRRSLLFIIIAFILFQSLIFLLRHCKSDYSGGEQRIVKSDSLIAYADFIQIIKGEPFDTLVSVNTWESVNPIVEKYPLIPRDCTLLLSSNIRSIPIPIRSCISMSTTYLPHLKLLGEEQTIIGMSGTAFVYDSLYNYRIAQGLVAEIGSDVAPDFERILSLSPDVLLAYGIAGGDNSYIQKLRTLGVKVLVINDYLENQPLGKLEYIKLFGLITDKFSIADSIFTARAEEYNELKQRCAERIAEKRRVLINLPFKDIWYVPGSKNYTSILIADAGGEILGSVEGESISSRESFEKMYTLGKEADVWINLNNFSTVSGVIHENPLYKNLQVVKDKRLYNNIKRNTPVGGSDFWEGGAVEPAEILKDLVTIFHPDAAEAEFGTRPMKYYIQLAP